MDEIRARVPVQSLFELSDFLKVAEQLKGLLLWRAQLRARDKGLMHSLDKQIGTMRALCAHYAEKNKLMGSAWKEVERELAQYLEDNGSEETTTSAEQPKPGNG